MTSERRPEVPSSPGGRDYGDLVRLSIYDHGASNLVDFGSDSLSAFNYGNYRGEFARLRGHFVAGGAIVLNQCFAAVERHQPLLMSISRTVDVPVFGGTGYTYDLFSSVLKPGTSPQYNDGTQMECTATGCWPAFDDVTAFTPGE